MLVEFIIPNYDRVDPLRAMLASLVAQTDKDWKATVVLDYPEDKDYFGMTADLINLPDDRISYICTDKRYNDWGHTPREIGKQQSEADYIIMTGDDNYYTPNFVSLLRTATLYKPGMVYWDMIHSHYDYQLFKTKLGNGQIDMGAFATRRDLAQQIKLGKEYDADGRFVSDYLKTFPKEQNIKINKCLFVHN
jgi:hypothetical protein